MDFLWSYFFVLVINYLFSEQVKILSEEGGLFWKLFCFLKHLWIGGLTHCFNRLKCGLTHCLINLYPSILGGVYIFFVVQVVIFLAKKVDFLWSYFFVLVINYLFGEQVKIFSEKVGLFLETILF